MADPLITFRISPEERKDLQRFCRRHKMTISEGMRTLIKANLRTPYDMILPLTLESKLEKIAAGSRRYGINDLIRQAVIEKFGEWPSPLCY